MGRAEQKREIYAKHCRLFVPIEPVGINVGLPGCLTKYFGMAVNHSYFRRIGCVTGIQRIIVLIDNANRKPKLDIDKVRIHYHVELLSSRLQPIMRGTAL